MRVFVHGGRESLDDKDWEDIEKRGSAPRVVGEECIG